MEIAITGLALETGGKRGERAAPFIAGVIGELPVRVVREEARILGADDPGHRREQQRFANLARDVLTQLGDAVFHREVLDEGEVRVLVKAFPKRQRGAVHPGAAEETGPNQP